MKVFSLQIEAILSCFPCDKSTSLPLSLQWENIFESFFNLSIKSDRQVDNTISILVHSHIFKELLSKRLLI